MKTTCFFNSLVFILFFSLGSKAQLSGNAVLSGQTIHTGIKIKFISTGGTAVTDSAYTSASGNYSINITGGAYKVVFSKSGYLDVNYNSGATVVLTNTNVLSNTTLLPGNQLFVTGNVSGNWTNANVYIVNGDITIAAGQALNISAGTQIRFNGNYSVTVNGTLTANGTAVNPVLFTSNYPNPAASNWNQVAVNNGKSVFNYCKFEYCDYGLNISNCGPLVINNEFTNFGSFGIYGHNCTSMISSNWIHDYNANWYGQGITTDGPTTATIECNIIHDAQGYGIRPFDRSIVKNNTIYNIKGNTRGIAFGCGAGTNALIQNNFIHDCNQAFWIYENVTPVPHPYIINNTMCNIVYDAIAIDGYYGNPDIINNIIVNNGGRGIFQSVPNCSPMCSTTPSVVANNIVWNNAGGNYVGVQIPGIGQIVSTNTQGNSVDSYFNMSQDPLFAGNTAPSLQTTSPAQHDGNSAYSTKIGFNTSYSCLGTVGIKNIAKDGLLHSIYPNPNTGTFSIRIDQAVNNVELRMINSIGQTVFARQINSGTTYIDTSELPKGFYLYTMVADKEYFGSGRLVIE